MNNMMRNKLLNKFIRLTSTFHQQNGIVRISSKNIERNLLENKNVIQQSFRNFCIPKIEQTTSTLDLQTFEKVCSDTLESLCDNFEEIVENVDHLKSADVSFGDGVLTVNLGSSFGTYVINRQTPNRQIWLSSPTSGPKRYDFIPHNLESKSAGYWFYKHDNSTLHELLENEIKIIAKKDVKFTVLPFGSR